MASHPEISRFRISHRIGFSVLALMVSLAFGCKDGIPIIIESSHGLSPDSRLEFTLDHLDNGMGFGMGALFDEVHIHKPGVRKFVHGDKDQSSVFYIESAYQEGDRPIVQWVGSSHLVIRHPGINKPGRAFTEFHGVTIEYQSFPLAPQKHQASP